MGVALRGHAWQVGIHGGGVHGRRSVYDGGMCGSRGGMCGGGGTCGRGDMCARRACMAGGHAWQWGMHGRYNEIRSMSGRYASYWNVFLFSVQ